MVNSLKRFVSKIDSIKDDKVYFNVFNILSSHDTVKNYTSNNNGVFFNLSTMDKSLINEAMECVDKYLEQKVKIKDFEDKRSEIISLYKNKTSDTYKSELSSLISGENNILYTDIASVSDVSEDIYTDTDTGTESDESVSITSDNLFGEDDEDD